MNRRSLIYGRNMLGTLEKREISDNSWLHIINCQNKYMEYYVDTI